MQVLGSTPYVVLSAALRAEYVLTSNHVSGSLTDADQKALMDALQLIREKLPFLTDLTTEERRTLPRMGDKTRAFVERAAEVANQNQGILPRGFDLEEYRRDVALINAMRPFATAFGQLDELIDDTMMALGSDAYTASLLVYQSAKIARADEGFDKVLDGLGRRFARHASALADDIAPAVTAN